MTLPDRQSAHRRAFFTADILCGLSLIAIVGVILLMLTARSMRASSLLAADRQAIELAESTLTHLQAGLEGPVGDGRTKIVVAPCTGGGAIAGHQWVQVTATVEGRSRMLVGLVPKDMAATVPAGGPQ